MNVRNAALCAALIGAWGSVAAPAYGASVFLPEDGTVVDPRPAFQFDFLRGTAEIEWSRSPDLLIAGANIGAFVDRTGGLFDVLYEHVPLDGVSRAEAELNSGQYFWHAKLRDDGFEPGSGTEGPWTAVRRMIVAKRPPVFEGWTLRAKRLKRVRGCDRVRLRGGWRASDNEDDFKLRLALTVRAGGRTFRSPGLLEGAFRTIANDFDRVVCTRASRLEVRPAVVDGDDQSARGPVRVVTVRSGVLP